MDEFRGVLGVIWLICLVSPANSTCLSGCTCTDDSSGRSLQCMEAPMAQIPDNISHDFTKIRIENCHLTELPFGSFSTISALESLWLNFNDITLMNIKSLDGLANLTELRLQGNKLTSIPWTAFQDTPRLKILDLKHNRLNVLPEHALRYLPGLTYLDLSFNHLTVISKDVFLNWQLYQRTERTWTKEGMVLNVLLALHDNPWTCDCRLKGFLEFIRAVNPPIILMNSYLTCRTPASKDGKFFHEVQLKTCLKPNASSPDANVTAPPGSNATLACFVKARPEPTIEWTYGLKAIRGFNATEAQIDEDTFSSVLLIPSLHSTDRGPYTCTANNSIGNSSAGVLVSVGEPDSTAPIAPPVPMLSPDENPHIDIRIAKQTVYGITLEWFAVTENPSETWYTIHFGKYDSPKKEMTYIGPGIRSYAVENLLPVTKYEVCVTLKNRPPREGQCVVFVTGSDVSELEQRERLIHIVVLVCVMILAVPAGMYACTAEARPGCAERCKGLWKRRRRRGDMQEMERQGTFDSLQAASSETLCAADKPKGRGGSAAHLY
ncbi:leucine-rich repeat, immunoglobulin-like domain and transmembrane domain-containing protein 2 [Eucyclogobius newberryi]|uniref:leucine-rich repeat, immunoglobulin-like domain and transmembrane domain-containing protein 2 n=1 Tax=Eucyclogobius newberryi TaxID=166745 RepID=UPI003B59C973